MSTEETVDELEIWREEIAEEFKQWLDTNDKELILSKAMCKLERSSPQDLFQDYPYLSNLLKKLPKLGLPQDMVLLCKFYEKYDPDFIKKRMHL